MTDEFGTELTSMIAAGAALVAATVSSDGAPRAERAWSATVVDPEVRRLRVAVSADDPVTVANLSLGSIAVTGADVQTFRSVQFKGRVVAIEPPTADDLAAVADQTERFFVAVQKVDRSPVEGLRRMLPLEIVMVEMIVEEQFDQSPGPGAGAALRAAPR